MQNQYLRSEITKTPFKKKSEDRKITGDLCFLWLQFVVKKRVHRIKETYLKV